MSGVIRSAIVTLEMIKIQHTVFALPFAFLAAVAAAEGMPGLRTIGWILVAMVGARSAAMAFNRLVDADIDGRNPRTRMRALPAGQVSRRYVALFAIASSALLLVAAWQLNRLALILAPVALLIVLGYSFTKRFTSWSHLFLGLALAIAPVGAAIAVTGRFVDDVWLLAGAVLCWTAGFDILYSMQDIEFDRAEGLHSIPVHLGASGAIGVSRFLHVLTIALLVTFGMAIGFGWIYYGGILAAAILLVWQHSLVSATDLSKIDTAFFTANGMLSIVVFVAGACDILRRAGGQL